ncbi:MAG: hypothetical protein JSS49_15190 [Planctomycetes bacterium]|nr:hypothetical protein [Planctomycetota bacterium]
MNESGGSTDAVLIVERANGRIRYPIQLAEWNLYEDERGEPHFYLRVDTDLPIREAGQPSRDEWWDNNDRPWWSLSIIQHGLRTSSIVPGTQFTLPIGYDESRGDYLTNILFDCVHQQSDNNTIAILAVDGDCLLVHMEGQTIHETFHDGPITTHTYAKLIAEGWFTRSES